MIIGITGKKQHGKDTIGKIIQYLSWLEYNKNSKVYYNTSYNKYRNLYSNGFNKIFEIKQFGGLLKQFVAEVTGDYAISMESESFKNKPLGNEWNNLTRRDLLQRIGTDVCRQIHPNFWVNSLMGKYRPKRYIHNSAGDYTEVATNWIITDIRFINEVDAIIDRGGFIIKTVRPSIISNDIHESETALDTINFKYTIINTDNNINYLINEVKHILKLENIIK